MIIKKIKDTGSSTFIGMNGGMIESPDGRHTACQDILSAIP